MAQRRNVHIANLDVRNATLRCANRNPTCSAAGKVGEPDAISQSPRELVVGHEDFAMMKHLRVVDRLVSSG